MILKCFAPLQCFHVPHHPTVRLVHPNVTSPTPSSLITTRRGALSTILISTTLFTLTPPSKSSTITEFSELPNSGGVKALDLRLGDGQVPADGDQVSVHYYGRLAAKQGWRFDSTYDHKDENGEPIPFVFVIGSGKVISGIETAVKSMKVGGVRRVVIPPSQGYQSTSQEPIPPNGYKILIEQSRDYLRHSEDLLLVCCNSLLSLCVCDILDASHMSYV